MVTIDFTVLTPTIEYLTSQVDGIKVIFTTTNSFEQVLRLFKNGLLLEEGSDYTVSVPNTITFFVAPKIHPLDGAEKIRAELI